MSESTPVYSIGAVAELVGIAPGTLRNWEDRFGLIIPLRSSGGHRLYSRLQVEHLRFLATRIGEGMQPGDAHRLLAEYLAAGGLPMVVVAESPRLGILLAERDPHAANLAGFFLKTEGYDTFLALSVAEAEGLFEREKPDVVIVDLLISDGAGMRLCRALKARGHVQVIAVSPLSSQDAALASGADAFLQKPIDPVELISTVRDLLMESSITKRPR
jgi:CheY-like chemotaxis protein